MASVAGTSALHFSLNHIIRQRTMDAEARRKAAAEARRAKVLARGGDRLAQITGSLPEPAGKLGTPAVEDSDKTKLRVRLTQPQRLSLHL